MNVRSPLDGFFEDFESLPGCAKPKLVSQRLDPCIASAALTLAPALSNSASRAEPACSSAIRRRMHEPRPSTATH